MKKHIVNSKVLFRFDRDEIKYSIQNAAFAQGDSARVHDKYGHDLLADDADHKMHQFKDVCEDGNWDRVLDIIRLSLGELEHEFLGYVRVPIADGYLTDNIDIDPSEFLIEVNIHPEFQMTTADYLMSLMKEYIVASVLDDWAGLTYPEGQAYWLNKKQETKQKIHITRSYCGVHHKVKPSLI